MRIFLIILIFAVFIAYICLFGTSSAPTVFDDGIQFDSLPFDLVAGIFAALMALAYFMPWGSSMKIRPIDQEPKWVLNLGMIAAPAIFGALGVIVLMNAKGAGSPRLYGIAITNIVAGFGISAHCYRAKRR